MSVESVQCFGRKKNAVAVSYCKRGSGLIRVNGKPLSLLEPEGLRMKCYEAILVVGKERFSNVDMRVRVKGGGHVAQVYAIRQAIAKSLVAYYQKCKSCRRAPSSSPFPLSHCKSCPSRRAATAMWLPLPRPLSPHARAGRNRTSAREPSMGWSARCSLALVCVPVVALFSAGKTRALIMLACDRLESGDSAGRQQPMKVFKV